MEWLQAVWFVVSFPVLAAVVHKVTRLVVAWIACPFSMDASWFRLQVYFDFDPVPSKATPRVITLVPLLVGSAATVITIQNMIWRQMRTTHQYYHLGLGIRYWMVYIASRLVYLRLALWPRIEVLLNEQMSQQ